MKNLLLVSPHFPPVSAADHQRVRQALPHLAEAGWRAEVVAVHPDDVRSARDPFLEQTIPPSIPVERVRGLSAAWARVPGLGSLGHRCAGAVARGIEAWIERHGAPPDLVYFSSTQFPVHRIIPRLKARHRMPVVMDYQDLWVNDYYDRHPEVRPPGGRLKYRLAQTLERRMERATLPHVDGFTSVSPAYVEHLRARHPAIAGRPFLVLPFGAATGDFDAVRRLDLRQAHFDPRDGHRHWVYVGRGGGDMAFALRGLFRAFRAALARDPTLENVRFHFLGTDYAHAAAARPSILPVAEAEGVAPFVREKPGRIPYSEALRCQLDAHALVVPGSDDPAYTASKIYPCILAGKPLLAVFHQASTVHEVLERTRAGVHVGFGAADGADELAARVSRAWFEPRAFARPVDTDWAAFEAYGARAMTLCLGAFLHNVASSAGAADGAPLRP